ncbi:helix-turn-helix transcriptional regulator [Streptomyces sp. NPDC048710]|uniref:helix-turn-helix transcriptional regulator n=1 Tax=unclassified Streptomyces TaxID=2593676 RepID=UPI00371ECBA7
MHADRGRRWTAADLAAQAGKSRAAFAGRFTALVGEPPSEKQQHEPPVSCLTHYFLLGARTA